MTDAKIPSAEEIFQEEANFVLREGTYEFQVEKILDEIKKLNKDNNTVTVSFKALPDDRLLEELEKQGYRVKFDTYYDSTKSEKYFTRVRVTNPKFSNTSSTFLDNLEDQIRGCAFSQSGVNNTEEAKKFIQSFMSNFQ